MVLDEDQPGLADLLHLRRFMTELVPLGRLRPAPELLRESEAPRGHRPSVLATAERDVVAAYLPVGGGIRLALPAEPAARVGSIRAPVPWRMPWPDPMPPFNRRRPAARRSARTIGSCWSTKPDLATETVTHALRIRDKRSRVIINTDAKNEADDQYAIVHGLLTPSFELHGIVPAHFGTSKSAHSLKDSHDEVMLLLRSDGARRARSPSPTERRARSRREHRRCPRPARS